MRERAMELSRRIEALRGGKPAQEAAAREAEAARLRAELRDLAQQARLTGTMFNLPTTFQLLIRAAHSSPGARRRQPSRACTRDATALLTRPPPRARLCPCPCLFSAGRRRGGGRAPQAERVGAHAGGAQAGRAVGSVGALGPQRTPTQAKRQR